MSSTSATSGRLSQGPEAQKTFIVGLSGPSSSGKTTLARLLRTIFSHPSNPASSNNVINVNTFIIHEDDFYKPDDEIPVVTTPRGDPVQDWDTLDALNVPQLTSTLSYVSRHGKLPANLKSKEDLNEATDSGVSDDTVEKLRRDVAQRLNSVLRAKNCQEKGGFKLSLAFLDGFLLYAPPGDEKHGLARVQRYIDVPIFLPATYSLMKRRREGRTGYVTIGPAPTPEIKKEGEGSGKWKTEEGEGDTVHDEQAEDDHAGYDPPAQNFWTDPPGYVDDIVWPRYIEDHAWLLVPKSELPRVRGKDISVLREVVGEGENIREDMGVIVAPGKGKAPMVGIVEWAVEEVMRRVEAGFE